MTQGWLSRWKRKWKRSICYTYVMNTKSLFIVISFLLGYFLVYVPLAAADSGPKPEMTFDFVYETTKSLSIVGGEQWQCKTATCNEAYILEEGGPQGFFCTTSGCRSRAYGYTDYNRLAVKFSDGITRESNIFETQSFNNQYRVTVRENDLLVERIGGGRGIEALGGIIILFFCFLLLIAGLMTGVIVWRRRRTVA